MVTSELECDVQLRYYSNLLGCGNLSFYIIEMIMSKQECCISLTSCSKLTFMSRCLIGAEIVNICTIL